MDSNLVVGASLAALAASWALACSSDDSTTYGRYDNLNCQIPGQPPGAACPPGGAGGGGGAAGGGSGNSGGGGGGDDAGASIEAGTIEGGCSTDGVDASCSVSWSQDLYPLIQGTGAWACGKGGCHAAPSGLPPLVDSTSPCTTYENFAQYSCSLCSGAATNEPLVKQGDTNTSDTAFMCVLQSGQNGCGQVAMPEAPGALGPNDLTRLQTWIGCGMPEN